LNSPPPQFFLSLLPLPGTVSTDIIFPFTYIFTKYLHYTHPPTPFPHLLSPPTSINPLSQDLFCPPVL
jgi:hypothetical protein